jgi:peptidoglycan/LPS O-acetylase OafA/YrhL
MPLPAMFAVLATMLLFPVENRTLNQTPASNRFVFLDGMRGIAALFVVTRHTVPFWNFTLFRSYMAVDIFFILSGFVLAHAYDNKLSSGRMSLRGFVLTRIIRLYPVYLLSLLIASIVFLAHVKSHEPGAGMLSMAMVAIGLAALFLPSSVSWSDELFTVNGPYWSLFFELIANALYATIHRHLSRAVLSVIIIASAISMLLVAFMHGNLNDGFRWGYGSLSLGVARAMFGFFLGVCLYRYPSLVPQALTKYLSPWLGLLLVAVALMIPSAGALDPIIDLSVVIGIFPLAVVIASRREPLKLKPLLLVLGSASYPIYVLHKPIGAIVDHASPDRIAAFAPVTGIILVAGLVWLCLVVEKYFDIPIRRRLTRISFKRPPAAQAEIS